MASTVRTRGGRRTARPGSYGSVNGSALTRIAAGARRLVLIGTAEGGIPVSVKTDGKPSFLNATTPEKVRSLFRSGNLRDAAAAAFRPSSDPRTPNGPSEILFAKVNPATQAAATFNNGAGAALTLTSRDYGAFANLINAFIGVGTTQGYSLRVTLEDLTEAEDDVGGDPAFDLRYDANGDFSTARGVVNATGTKITFTDQYAAAVVTATHNVGDQAVVLSSSTYDTVQSVTVYGTDADDLPVKETVALNGTTTVTTTQAYKTITAARVNGATRGTITIRDEQVAPNVAFTIAAQIVADHPANGGAGEEAEVVSANAADVGQTVVVYGYSPGGVAMSEAIVLNGTTAAAGAKKFGKITAAQLSAVAAGNVTVRAKVTDDQAFVITAGALSKGLNVGAGVYIPDMAALNGALQLKHAAGPGAGTFFAVVRGRTTAGVDAAERVVLTGAFATTTTLFAELHQIELGKGEAGNAIDSAGTAIDLPRSSYPYLQQVVDAVNGRRGFYATARIDGADTFLQADLDHADNAIKGASVVNYLADNYSIAKWFNDNSALVAATRPAAATGAPNVTPAAVFLVGGGEGTTTTAHWQAAYDALKGERDVVIVPLTTNAAVHAIDVAHKRHMEGAGREVRSGFVPMATTLTRAQLKSAIRLLNDRNTCAVAQSVTLYNEAGVATVYGPEVLAAIAGAMRCGSDVAEPLTWKAINALAFAQNTDWDPVQNADEMIQMGLLFAREDQRVGFVWERGVTTYRTDDNPVFTEESANDSANASVKDLQNNLDTQIGTKGFAARAAIIKAMAEARLDLQVAEGTIKAWRDVDVIDLGDTYDVAYNLAAIEPTNFIPITANLIRIPSSAAA